MHPIMERYAVTSHRASSPEPPCKAVWFPYRTVWRSRGADLSAPKFGLHRGAPRGAISSDNQYTGPTRRGTPDHGIHESQIACKSRLSRVAPHSRIRSPAPRDASGVLYGSVTAARPIRRSTRFWNISPEPGWNGYDCTAGTAVLLFFFRLRRGRLRLHLLLRAVPLAVGASDFSILSSGLRGACWRRRRFLLRRRVAIVWNGPCPLCGPPFTGRRYACRWPHTRAAPGPCIADT